jgi:GTP-binding protein
MDIRNIAIIAHVDHGKTTLVDGLLKQSKTFRENEAAMSQTLILDSNDQERERGITILAKNTAVNYLGTKINIIDTPGHADFGGEVERTLNMADGALLIIDAQEGPMPQTKFVLKKALEIGLKVIVVINKIDKKDAHIPEVIERTYDLFLDLASHEDQLNFPIYYAIGREGKAWDHLPSAQELTDDGNLDPLFEAVLKYIPAPEYLEGSFQLLVAALDWDSFQGKYVIGRVRRGEANPGKSVTVINRDGERSQARIDHIYVSQGLKRQEVDKASTGDIIVISGVKNASIGDTLTDPNEPDALPTIQIEAPTLKMSVMANTSPFAGREGRFVTSRQILDRIKRELEVNVSMHLEISSENEYILAGRGELHLSVFIETLRREGYELQVGKPQVITNFQNGVEVEPIEELTVDVTNEYVSTVTGEVLRRRGLLHAQEENSDSTTRLVFEIPTRGLLGLRNQLLNISRGTAVLNSMFLRFEPLGTSIPKLRNGVLIASEAGKAVTYGLDIAQGRGITFIPPGTEVYEGMLIGLNNRENDIEINVTKEKKQTNVRSSNADMATILTPPTVFSLEQALDFLEDDELLECTPKSLRLRKKILDSGLRAKSRKNS